MCVWQVDGKKYAFLSLAFGETFFRPIVFLLLQNQDIHWYSRDQESADEAARKKAEEIRKVKEAEEDALAVALSVFPFLRMNRERC